MAFEGNHKVIPIKGIARAGADTVCEDGVMNEVIGLEYKDGSFVPYNAVETMADVLPSSTTAIYTHKTTKGEVVIIKQGKTLYWKLKDKLKDDNEAWNKLSEAGKVEFVGDAVSVLYKPNVLTYVFNGVSYTKLESDLSEFSSNLLKFRVKRGVAGHEKVKDSNDEEKDPISVQYLSRKYYSQINGSASDIYYRYSEFLAASEDISLGSSLLTRASGMITEYGGLQGYFLVCYAFRLTNGDIVQASMPVLMSPPSTKQRGCFTDPNTDIDPFAERDVYERSEKYIINSSVLETEGPVYTSFSEHMVSLKDKVEMLAQKKYGTSAGISMIGKNVLADKDDIEKEGLCSDTLQYIYRTDYSTDKSWGKIMGTTGGTGSRWFFSLCKNSLYVLPDLDKEWDEDKMNTVFLAATATMPLTSSITMHIRSGNSQGGHGDNSWEKNNVYKMTYCEGVSNKLQIAINESIIDNLPDTISSVCVFISPEISPFLEITEDNVITHGLFVSGLIRGTSSGSSNNVRFMHTFTPKYRSKDTILEDVKNISSMYKVKEISIGDLKNMVEENKDDNGDQLWIDVDLRGLLGDTLLTLEQLPLTAFDYTKYEANASTAYNYRLHIGNIYRYLYDGYSRLSLLNDYNNGRGQYCNVTNVEDIDSDVVLTTGDKEVRNIITVTHIKNEDSSESITVMNEEEFESNKTLWGLNSMIVYPNPNAYKMDIYEQTIDNKYMKYTVNLVANKKLGFAYYLHSELKPFIGEGEEVETFSQNPLNDVRYSPNLLKVSDTAAPHILPAKNTYTVGNGTILGFARINTALADDTYGRNPLLIFATDGIYTMEVDSSGAGAYLTSPNLFSNEICVNPNSICEIIGGVVFASNKGLMVATSNGVIPFTPMLNGKPSNKPQTDNTPYGSGMKLYGMMVGHIGVSDYISEDDFIDFVKNEKTHVVYIGVKNKLYIYKKDKSQATDSSAYWVDIDTRIATKLTDVFDFNDNSHPSALFVGEDKIYTFEYLPQDNRTPVLLQTRPIKIDSSLKTSYRVVLRGYFHASIANHFLSESLYSSLLVLGSLDGKHWQPIGVKEKEIIKLDENAGKDYEQPFHDIGCVTDRVSVKYIMVAFSSFLDADSHIDNIEITVNDKYNNKLR